MQALLEISMKHYIFQWQRTSWKQANCESFLHKSLNYCTLKMFLQVQFKKQEATITRLFFISYFLKFFHEKSAYGQKGTKERLQPEDKIHFLMYIKAQK